MTRDIGPKCVCYNLAEVQEATNHLDRASIMPLKGNDNGVWKEITNHVGVYNNSKGRFCTTVAPHYNLIQHKEYFDGFAAAMDRLSLKYTMTIRSSGNKAFADIEFEGRNIKFEKLDEEFTTGIRLANSYDKTCGLFIAPRLTRLACTNGMILTRIEKTLSVKHHTKILKEIESFIENRLNQIVVQDYELQNWVASSMKDSIEWMTACKIISKLFNQRLHMEKILSELGISIVEIEDKKTKKKSITYVWDDNKNKKNKLNRWQLYNAVTSYLTHGEHITPHIESLFHQRAERLLITPLAKIKVKRGF